jgi:hypothetical protein
MHAARLRCRRDNSSSAAHDYCAGSVTIGVNKDMKQAEVMISSTTLNWHPAIALTGEPPMRATVRTKISPAAWAGYVWAYQHAANSDDDSVTTLLCDHA